MKVYDAENQIVGRLATTIAKDLLKGEDVVVVNAEKAVLSGSPRFKKEFYLQRIQRGSAKHGPFFPKPPDAIFRRAVRGMLPWDKPKGRKAFKRLKVYLGLPEEFKNKKLERVANADASKLKCKYITLGELSLGIGGKKRW
jgi:large subunit ribosomal protein L13